MRTLTKVLMITAIVWGALISIKVALEIWDLGKKRYVASGTD